MKRLIVSLVVLLLVVPAFGASDKGGVKKARGKRIDGQYIVVFNDRVADPDAAADELVRMNRGRKGFVYRSAIKGFSAQMSPQAAEALSRHPLVDSVEEDAEVHLEATQSPATWGLDRIDQRDLPLSNSYTYNYTGSGVKAYIIDTGIRMTHGEFGGRAINGYDAVDGGSADDCNGHGTHVAGTVGGSTYGVAKSVTLVAVRVLDCNGSGSNSGVIAGVDWVTSDHAAGAPAVANMSLGGGANSALDTAVRNSIADGVTYAIASGNSNADACGYSPARVAEAITVNSSTSTDARSSFSNWGTCTDIFAPGSSITSAWHTSDTATNTISGTSMATPHVAGVAALVLHQFGNLTPNDVWIRIRDNSTANKITSPGTGSPNRLLHSLWGSGTPAPTISSFSPTSGGVGTVVRVNGTNFTGASAVRFNGQSASFTVVSASAIDATVPNCSSSGQISVTTAGGTATSSGSFSVTGCGGGAQQLLLNPGFELGNNGNWTITAGVIDNSASPAARTGSWKAWLCGYGTTHTDYAYQSVTIPSTATSATLSYWLRITSSETTTTVAYDTMRVQVSTNGGSTWTTLVTYSNLNKGTFSSYAQRSHDLTAYKGLTVRVRFYATEDSSLQTSFLVDDTALNTQ